MKFWTGISAEKKAKLMKVVIAIAVVMPFGCFVLVGLAVTHWLKDFLQT